MGACCNKIGNKHPPIESENLTKLGKSEIKFGVLGAGYPLCDLRENCDLNCLLWSSEGPILIDAGSSACQRLNELNISVHDLRAILITECTAAKINGLEQIMWNTHYVPPKFTHSTRLEGDTSSYQKVPIFAPESIVENLKAFERYIVEGYTDKTSSIRDADSDEVFQFCSSENDTFEFGDVAVQYLSTVSALQYGLKITMKESQFVYTGALPFDKEVWSEYGKRDDINFVLSPCVFPPNFSTSLINHPHPTAVKNGQNLPTLRELNELDKHTQKKMVVLCSNGAESSQIENNPKFLGSVGINDGFFIKSPFSLDKFSLGKKTVFSPGQITSHILEPDWVKAQISKKNIVFGFTGTGSALCDYAKNTNTNGLLFTESEGNILRPLLVDCGNANMQQLTEMGISIMDIEGVVVTHIHGDHLNGLEDLVRARFCSSAPNGKMIMKKTKLYICSDVLLRLRQMMDILFQNWKYDLSSSRNESDWKRGEDLKLQDLDRSYSQAESSTCHHGHRHGNAITFEDVFEIVEGVNFSVGQYDLRMVPMPHARAEDGSFFKPSYGIQVIHRGNPDCEILYTSDTAFVPNLHEQFPNSKIVFHDVVMGAPYKGTVHTHYAQIQELPEWFRSRIVIVDHVSIPSHLDIKKDGILYAAQRQEIFSITSSSHVESNLGFR